MISRKAYSYILLWLATLFSSFANAHGQGPAGRQPLDWHTEKISRADAIGGIGRTFKIEDKECMTGTSLDLDVSDEYAFDIDETVEVEMEFDLKTSHPDVTLVYDNFASSAMKQVQLSGVADSRWHKETFILDRARFAALGDAGMPGYRCTGSPGVDRAGSGNRQGGIQRRR